MGGTEGIRLAVFLLLFLLIALAELVWPRRKLAVAKGNRWMCNIGIVLIDYAAARLLMPLMPIGMAEIASIRGWGLFNMVVLPHWLEIALAVLALDLVIYLQHRAFHRLPIFWRIHRMHHTDLDLDVSTGNRFHPLEILISLVIKICFVALLGAPVMAVLLFEIILNATSLFNHGNLRLPLRVDGWLRLLLVTPDMHRVHHSIHPQETDSNFGFSVPWWDRLLGSYRDQPRDGHDGMTIGLKEFRDADRLGFGYLLLLPWRGREG